MTAALNAKQSSPLERLTLDQDARDVVAAYDAFRQEISNLGKALIAANDTIRAVQEQVKGAQVQTIERDLQRLHATKRRHSLDIAPLCTAYSDEKASKARTEFQRAKAKTALEDHKANAFPASQTAINDYLRRFNTGFRLGSVSSTSTRGGPTCNYDVVINETVRVCRRRHASGWRAVISQYVEFR